MFATPSHFITLQFTDAFQKYGISSDENSPVLAVEVAENEQSKMDEIIQLVKGDPLDISRLSSMCDHQLIKQVHVLSL